jgi:DUF4097 and DUF4098 domain-containing protein YvlB
LSATGKGSGILLAGIALVAMGVILLLALGSVGFALWLGGLWPLFLILAGLFSVAGFVMAHRPRSPLGGMLLVAVGIILLLGRIGSESNPLAVYGTYWIVVLGIYSAAELLRFYCHRQGEGPQPRFFSIRKVLVVLLIASTGILSGRIARRSKPWLSTVSIPASLASLTESGGPRAYSFEDPASVTDVSGESTAIINNTMGDINVTGGANSLRVLLTKTVNSRSEAEARDLADQIKLVIERTPDGIRIGTNRDLLNGDFKTDLKIEVPRGLVITLRSKNGSVSLKRAEGPLSVSAAGGPVSLSQISGDVEIALDGSNRLDASNVAGNVSIEGARDVKTTNIGGGLDLKASNGSLELRDVRGPVSLDAMSCDIKASNLMEHAIIKSGHSTIDVVKTSSLTIEGPGSSVRAEQVSGELQVTSSDGMVHLQSIRGGVVISASRSTVAIDGLRGEARVQGSYSAVSIRDFRGGAFVETSHNRVVMVPGDPVADIQVKNTQGDIRMILPLSGDFQLNAEAAQGSIRCPSLFGNPNLDGAGANLSFGSSGPRIALATVQGDITLEQTHQNGDRNR